MWVGVTENLFKLSSTTSQPNNENRTAVLATIARQVRDLPIPPTRKERDDKVPHGADHGLKIKNSAI